MTAADLATAGHVEELRAELRQVRVMLENIAAALPSTWVPLREAAKRMGCDPRTVQAAGERGDIVIKRVGRRVMVDAASLRPASEIDVARLAREARGQ